MNDHGRDMSDALSELYMGIHQALFTASCPWWKNSDVKRLHVLSLPPGEICETGKQPSSQHASQPSHLHNHLCMVKPWYDMRESQIAEDRGGRKEEIKKRRLKGCCHSVRAESFFLCCSLQQANIRHQQTLTYFLKTKYALLKASQRTDSSHIWKHILICNWK